jgi:TPP-dependent pyruvate/acetoin dehydrogenase alpha subunit
MTQKAEGYNMPSAQVDGMDLMAVYEKTKEMLEKIRGAAAPCSWK